MPLEIICPLATMVSFVFVVMMFNPARPWSSRKRGGCLAWVVAAPGPIPRIVGGPRPHPERAGIGWHTVDAKVNGTVHGPYLG